MKRDNAARFCSFLDLFPARSPFSFTAAGLVSRKRISMTKRTLIILLGLVAMTINSPAQTFTTLVNLDTTTTGSSANLSLQGIDGNLYGTMSAGGAYGHGTIFRMTPRGQLTTLYNFCATPNCPDGAAPGALLQAINSSLYGITGAGGAGGNGTVFEFTPAGEFKTLYSFCSDPNTCTDGWGATTLVPAANGNFYGLTTQGSANCVWANTGGAFFEISPNGTFTVIAPICQQDGGSLPPTLLAQGNDGDFFAYTYSDFLAHSFVGSGAFYKITPQGSITGAWGMCVDKRCEELVHPMSAIEVPSGDFWGTWRGGSDGGGIFKFTEVGQFKSACSCPGVELTVVGSDGNLYGSSAASAQGAVIEFTTPPATVTTIHNFEGTDGNGGTTSLQDTNGDFYGLTYGGGAHSDGTIFRLSTGLSPFVAMLPSAGRSGSAVFIKGTGISGATQVTFNGVAAKFVKASPSALKAIVPAGLSGPVNIEVTAPSGPLQGNVPFRVLP
jgi:uncharacterized repeat protein (TIGR03803 family)